MLLILRECFNYSNIYFQKTYPHLPEEGTMHLTLYNGINSLNHSKICNGFVKEASIISDNGDINKLQIDDFIHEIFVPEDNYNISIGTYQCKYSSDILFNTIQFQPPDMVKNSIGFNAMTFKEYKIFKELIIIFRKLFDKIYCLGSHRWLQRKLPICLSECSYYNRLK